METIVRNSVVNFHYEKENYHTLNFEVQIKKDSPIQPDAMIYSKVFEDFLNNYSEYKKVFEERDFKSKLQKSLKDFEEKENHFFEMANFCKEHNFEIERQINFQKSEIYRSVQRTINYNLNF